MKETTCSHCQDCQDHSIGLITFLQLLHYTSLVISNDGRILALLFILVFMVGCQKHHGFNPGLFVVKHRLTCISLSYRVAKHCLIEF